MSSLFEADRCRAKAASEAAMDKIWSGLASPKLEI
jgi:hypothetical protein